MPELPEVETIRRGLSDRILGKVIGEVEVRQPRMVRGGGEDLEHVLRGRSFESLERRGKLLIFTVDGGGQYLLVHLKMTGQLIYEDAKEMVGGGHPYPAIGEGLPNKFSHIIIGFVDGSKLFFNDMRQFGYMRVVDDEGRQAATQVFGPEPLTDDFLWKDFYAAVKRRSAPLKAVLLNQSVVAGLGNIYVDEVCFLAGVRPDRRANDLTRSQVRAVFEQIPQVLAEAIAAGGTTFRHFRDDAGGKGNYVKHLRVYGRGGEACTVCGARLHKEKVAGRGTVWCPKCQK